MIFIFTFAGALPSELLSDLLPHAAGGRHGPAGLGQGNLAPAGIAGPGGIVGQCILLILRDLRAILSRTSPWARGCCGSLDGRFPAG